MTVNELRAARAELVKKAQAIYDVAANEKREPNAEERGQFDKMMEDVDRLGGDAERLEKLEAVKRSLKESAGNELGRETPGRKGAELRDGEATAEQRAEAFEEFLRTGDKSEYRALQADVQVTGGYLTTPQEMAAGLIKAVDNVLPIRGLATRYTLTSAHSLGFVSLDTDPADPTWTTELGTGSEDTAMAFGKREMCPHPIAQRIKLSEKLLRMTANVTSLVQERMAYKHGVVLENAYMTGNGASKPLGLFTASTQGISTGRDVSTGNSSTALTVEGLINALYTLKDQYRNSPSVRWLFHRDAIKMIRKLRSDSGAGAGTGDFLWQPSVQAGQPDLLLGVPVFSSEYCPNTFTTGLYVGMVGDFSKYAICDALSMTIKRLDELYAETAQVGFISRLESDGMPLLEEAFVRVKLA